MTNYEKYKEVIIEALARGDRLAKVNNELTDCDCSNTRHCRACDFSSYKNPSDDVDDGGCVSRRKAWLNAEYKKPITLNEREHAFCVAFGSGWIARDVDGSIFYYCSKPNKKFAEGQWRDSLHIEIDMSYYCDDLKFDFIKWSDFEPYSIEELLRMPVKESGE